MTSFLLVVFTLFLSIRTAICYDCSDLGSKSCSDNKSTDDFDDCIVSTYSVSELIQCAEEDHTDIKTRINGDSHTTSALDILKKVSSNHSCADHSLRQAFDEFDPKGKYGFLKYLCTKAKIHDEEICALSSCFNTMGDEHSIDQSCRGEPDGEEDDSSSSFNSDLMSQTALSTCGGAASTSATPTTGVDGGQCGFGALAGRAAPSANSGNACPGASSASRGSSASLSTIAVLGPSSTGKMVITNGATPQTPAPTAKTTTSGDANSAAERRGDTLWHTSLFAIVGIVVLNVL